MAGRPQRRRTLIEWNPAQDQAIMADVLRFHARAIGTRLRELLVMGQAAERMGMRVQRRDGGLAAEMPPGWQSPVPYPAKASVLPEPAQDTPPESAPGLSAEHQRGLETLFAGLDIGDVDNSHM